MIEDPELTDLVQLLGPGALANIIANQSRNNEKSLSRLFRRAHSFFEIARGRRGPRRAYFRHVIRQYARSKNRDNEAFLAILSDADDVRTGRGQRLLQGIGHYGLFHAEIGIGQAARRLAKAMKSAEIPLSLHNIDLPQFESCVDFDVADTDWSSFDTVLLHFNADTLLHLFDRLPLEALFRRRRIGHWVWELPVFPAQWVPAFDKIHEVWAPSRFVARVIASATTKPVRIVPYPVPLDHYPKAEARRCLGLPLDKFIFLTIFDLNSYPSRKNPLGAVKAYMDAFPKHGPSSPLLIIKCHGRSNRGEEMRSIKKLCANDRHMLLIDKVFSEEDMTLIQSACDCLISLHRAEGFGLNIAECMAKAKIVVATDFSGSRDFARPENSLLVPYKMSEVGNCAYPFGGGQWWAEPNHDAAVGALRHAASNSLDVLRLATRARADIARDYSFENIGKIATAAWKQESEVIRA